MALNPYQAIHRQWNHVGNLFPNFEHSDGERPNIETQPAPWLPVQIYDRFLEVYSVISPGKLVALTTAEDEWLVPAGLRLSWNAAAGGDTIITYTANDVSEYVVDITTGEAVTAAVSYNKTQVTTALRSRGLIGAAEDCDAYISRPVGVAALPMYSNAFANFDSTKAKYLQDYATVSKFHNFYMQHLGTILCDYVLRIAHVPAIVSAEALPAALTAGAPALGSGNVYSATRIKTLTRYSSLTGSSFVAYCTDHYPVARNVRLTPVTPSNSALMQTKKGDPDALSQVGDWFADWSAGVIFFYSADGATLPAAFTGTLTYYAYDSAPATVGNYVCAVGDVPGGEFVECDANSNFVLATSTDFRDIMGQRLTSWKYPRSSLDKVASQYTAFGTFNRMPGMATEGISDTITYAGGSDAELIINLISR